MNNNQVLKQAVIKREEATFVFAVHIFDAVMKNASKSAQLKSSAVRKIDIFERNSSFSNDVPMVALCKKNRGLSKTNRL